MGDVTWPSWMPQCPRATHGGEVVDQRISFAPERAALPIERPGTTAMVKRLQITLPVVSAATLDAFETWLQDDLAGGALPFGWRDPYSSAVHRFRFSPGALSKDARRGPDQVELSFELLRLPGQPWYAPYTPAGAVLAPEFLADFEASVFAVAGSRAQQAATASVVTGGVSVSGGALVGDGVTPLEVVLASASPVAGSLLVEAYSSSGGVVLDATDGTNTLALGSAAEAQRFSAAVAWDAAAGLMWGALDGVAGLEAEEVYAGSAAPLDILPPLTGGIYRVIHWPVALSKAGLYALTN